MAEQTTSSIEIAADTAEVMAVIVDFESYPRWVQGMKHVEVRRKDAQGRPEHVYFELEATPIKDAYTLEYDYVSADVLRWHLVEGKMMRALDGAYELRQKGAGTEVTYRLSVDLAIPMIGMLRRKAEKVIIDTALKGLKKRVESQA
jgi:ribosome-associated toxin RatA of RatAB toxin-antitoxin module